MEWGMLAAMLAPYIIGMFQGNGSSGQPSNTSTATMDPEIRRLLIGTAADPGQLALQQIQAQRMDPLHAQIAELAMRLMPHLPGENINPNGHATYPGDGNIHLDYPARTTPVPPIPPLVPPGDPGGGGPVFGGRLPGRIYPTGGSAMAGGAGSLMPPTFPGSGRGMTADQSQAGGAPSYMQLLSMFGGARG